MSALVTDVSSWNPDTFTFFHTLHTRGVKASIIKLSEGTTYRNPKAAAQAKNSWAAGLHVHGYHYARFKTIAQAQAEARYFATAGKQLGLNHTSVMALDLEDPSLPAGDLTALVNAFLTTLKQQGYPKVDLYTAASWHWYGRVKVAKLPPLNLWVARYGASRPGVDHVGTWQFTDNWQGLHVDMSTDFFGYYTQV